MEIEICMGSSCHVKGSQAILATFQQALQQHGLVDKIQLKGAFCLGSCRNGVCVNINNQLHFVQPESALAYFETNVLEVYYATHPISR